VAIVRYFAGAKVAAGVREEQIEASDLATLLDRLGEAHGRPLIKVLGACSFLIDGLACHDPLAALDPGSTVDVLPPFAGG
jgi:molybdopterin converting factor small subunit